MQCALINYLPLIVVIRDIQYTETRIWNGINVI